MNLPHARKQLHQSAITERETHDQVWRRQVASAHIDQAEYEGCQRESREPQRSWVGKLAVLDWLVETRLELTTESWKTLSVAVGIGVGKRSVAKASGGFGGLMLLVRHVVGEAVGLLLLCDPGIGSHNERVDQFEGCGEGRAEVGEM